jgi:MFS family permease
LTRIGLVVHRTFHSLHARNFRLFFIGQVVSVTGTWLNATASAWLVIRLSHASGVALGFNIALTFLPILLVGAFGGMLADRHDKRKILIVTQAAYAILALTLFGLVASDIARLWMVYVLSFAAGLVTALDNPTRQSFYMELVPENDVTNAVSLNSAVFMGARIVGASLAAAVIAAVGIAPCFLVDAVSYMAVIVALLAMRPADLLGRERATRDRGGIREGFRYVWTTPELRSPLVLMTIVFTFAFNWSVLLPLLARRTFGGSAATFGIMSALTGVGAFVAAIVMANRASAPIAPPSIRRLSVFSIGAGVALLLPAVAPTLGLAYATMVPLGLSVMIFIITANSMLQLRSKPAFRGRVMALYGMVFLGSTPVGSVLTGWLAQHWGPRAGFVLGGAAALVAGLGGLWWRARAWTTSAVPIDEDVAVEGMIDGLSA